MSDLYTIGVDFGTDSVRSVIINCSNGEEVAAAVFYYPRWKESLYCNPSANQYRQHPADYIEGLEHTIKDCIAKAGETVTKNIKGIGVDTTGSTPVAVNEKGVPLALLDEFKENPNAMFILWKDHTSIAEAEEINLHTKKFTTNYLQYVGGIYSSEWFWAKLLHVIRNDNAVKKSAYSWVEHCDWIPFLLTGGSHISEMKRSVCAAGHKALWSENFGGYPPNDFFASLDISLDGLTERLYSNNVCTSDKPAGKLCKEWAIRLGLSEDVVIATGAFDAHIGAVGGEIEPYFLSKVMGTSTCDIMVAPTNELNNKVVKGICGQVNGSVIPGMTGLEAGQSAFGDAYAWFTTVTAYSLQFISDEKLRAQTGDALLASLSNEASALSICDDDELAVDWFNGRRTPDANQQLKGAIMNLSLGSNAPKIFKAIVESTCFGAKAIAERFTSEGIPVKGLIGMGGVAKKSPFIMQMMADVMNMPIKIHKSDQTCAAGAAMFAATAAGIYNKVEDAMQKMGSGFDTTYEPDKAKNKIYEQRYKKYKASGEFIERCL